MKKIFIFSLVSFYCLQLAAQYKVGINNKTPAYPLDVYDSAEQGVTGNFSSGNISNSFLLVNGNASSSQVGIGMYRKGNPAAYSFIDSSGNYNVSTMPGGGEFILTNEGEVGIGSDDPFAQLDVLDFDNTGYPLYVHGFNDTACMYGVDVDNNTGRAGLAMYRLGKNLGQLYLNSNNDFELDVGKFNKSNIELYASSSSGNVGIGTRTPGVTLDVNGGVRGTSAYQVSDIRLKKDIAPVTNGLAKLSKLKAVEYHWDENNFFGKKFDNADQEQIGFIAQEVEKVLPNLVSTDGQGLKSVEYTQVIPLLVEGMKEQQKEIDLLKQEIEELKHKK